MFCCLGCVEWLFSRSKIGEDLVEWDEKIELIAVDQSERRKKEWLPSMLLIVKRNLPRESREWTDKQVLDAVANISHLRLDGESIEKLDFIHLLNELCLTNIYFQNNEIERLENIHTLSNLQFLNLSNNKISNIENVSNLHQLLYLDLSKNLIEEVDVDDIPQSLMILDLSDNPCTLHPDYRGRIIQDLPNLNQLDGQQITKQELQECGYILFPSDNSDDDSEESENQTKILEYTDLGNKIDEKNSCNQEEWEKESEAESLHTDINTS